MLCWTTGTACEACPAPATAGCIDTATATTAHLVPAIKAHHRNVQPGQVARRRRLSSGEGVHRCVDGGQAGGAGGLHGAPLRRGIVRTHSQLKRRRLWAGELVLPAVVCPTHATQPLLHRLAAKRRPPCWSRPSQARALRRAARRRARQHLHGYRQQAQQRLALPVEHIRHQCQKQTGGAACIAGYVAATAAQSRRRLCRCGCRQMNTDRLPLVVQNVPECRPLPHCRGVCWAQGQHKGCLLVRSVLADAWREKGAGGAGVVLAGEEAALMGRGGAARMLVGRQPGSTAGHTPAACPPSSLHCLYSWFTYPTHPSTAGAARAGAPLSPLSPEPLNGWLQHRSVGCPGCQSTPARRPATPRPAIQHNNIGE